VNGIDLIIENAPVIEKANGTAIIDPLIVPHSVAVVTILRDFVKTKFRATVADAIHFKRVVVVNVELGITITIVTIGLSNPKVVVLAEEVAVHSIPAIVPPNRPGAADPITTTVIGDFERPRIDRRSDRSTSVDAIIRECAKKKLKTNAADVQRFKRVVRVVVRAAVTILLATKKEMY